MSDDSPLPLGDLLKQIVKKAKPAAKAVKGRRLAQQALEAKLGKDAARATVRELAPRVDGVADDDLGRDPLARAARLPGRAFEVARASLADGAPVLVQVPRRGYAPIRDSVPLPDGLYYSHPPAFCSLPWSPFAC